MTGSVVGNNLWSHLKSPSSGRLRLIIVRRLNRDRLAAQTTAESKLEGVIKLGDSGEVTVGTSWPPHLSRRTKLVRTLLKRMSLKATNLIAELHLIVTDQASHCRTGDGCLRTKSFVMRIGPFFINYLPGSLD